MNELVEGIEKIIDIEKEGGVMFGLIWRGNKLDYLTVEEARYWDYHILPFGWAIIKYPDEYYSERRSDV